MSGRGTSEDPWRLTTAPGWSTYTMLRQRGALVEHEHDARNGRVRAI